MVNTVQMAYRLHKWRTGCNPRLPGTGGPPPAVWTSPCFPVTFCSVFSFDSRNQRSRVATLAWMVLVASCATAEVSTDEADRIAEALGLESGMNVADVGAGDGEWAMALAERVGADGHVFATEVDEGELRDIRERLDDVGLVNVTPVLGSQDETGLPEGCCDAILLRMVYHHFVRPEMMRDSLYEALRPGARLAIIDIVPQKHWGKLPEVPDRGGHGIPPEDLIDEMTARGFILLERFDDWAGDDDRFCLVFAR